jgi:hypothetical protein
MTGNQKPRELTSGKQGATHSPVFNAQGDKVAWTELDEDGYESDRLVTASGLHTNFVSNSPMQSQGRHIRPRERHSLHTHAALGPICGRTYCEA